LTAEKLNFDFGLLATSSTSVTWRFSSRSDEDAVVVERSTSDEPETTVSRLLPYGAWDAGDVAKLSRRRRGNDTMLEADDERRRGRDSQTCSLCPCGYELGQALGDVGGNDGVGVGAGTLGGSVDKGDMVGATMLWGDSVGIDKVESGYSLSLVGTE
jgi:hypothetical protein